jgi:hypothetical protein
VREGAFSPAKEALLELRKCWLSAVGTCLRVLGVCLRRRLRCFLSACTMVCVCVF